MNFCDTTSNVIKTHVNDLVHSFISKVSMPISIVSELRIRTVCVAQAFVSALLRCDMGYVLIALCSLVDFMRPLNNLYSLMSLVQKIS